MSKKSRKKQKPEKLSGVSPVGDPSEESAAPEEHLAPHEEPSEEAVARAVDVTTEETELRDLPEGVAPGTLSGEPASGEPPRLSLILEAILFASQKAVTAKELVTHLRNAAAAATDTASPALAYAKVKEGAVVEALTELQAEVAATGRAYQVRETATGWLLSSAPGYAPWLRALYPEAKPTRLSASALETLAIIAYRQPITRADIEAVRGVSVDGVMQTLLDRGLVKIAGRSETPGRPLLYATTQFFLDHFGLRHLDELPNAAELRHIPLPKAEVAEKAPSQESTENSPELPGVLEEGSFGSTGLETVEVTEIMEVRESVVFEKVVDDAVPSGQEVLPEEESESGVEIR